MTVSAYRSAMASSLSAMSRLETSLYQQSLATGETRAEAQRDESRRVESVRALAETQRAIRNAQSALRGSSFETWA